MVRAVNEKKALRDFERLLPEIAINADVWRGAYELARKARSGGVSIPATDLLIAACAQHHDAELEHSDSDFELLEKL
jgi:predicted nucleic acid-binding protein